MRTKSPFLAVIPVLIVLICILFKNPFFGLMDDAHLLEEVGRIQQLGLWRATINYVQGDLDWGMFRPTYPLMIKLLYGFIGTSSLSLFLLNFVFVLFVTLAFGSAFYFVLRSRFFLDSELSIGGRKFLAVFTLALLAFPWSHDLFLHPSLQEKLVLLAGAISLFWFGCLAAKTQSLSYYLVSTLVLLFGFSTKAQYVMFLPAIWVFLVQDVLRRRLNFARFGYSFMLSVVLTVALRKLAAHGSYTNHFELKNIFLNLHNPRVLVLFAFAALSFVVAFYLAKQRRIFDVVAASAPGLIILAYLSIFLQWSVNGYLLSSIGGTVAVTTAMFILLLPRRVERLAILTLTILSVSVSFYRSNMMFGALADIRRIVYSDEIEMISKQGATVYMSCPEGGQALSYYIKRFRQLDVTVKNIEEYDKNPGAYFIADRKLCPMTVDGKSLVLRSPQTTGFQIYK